MRLGPFAKATLSLHRQSMSPLTLRLLSKRMTKGAESSDRNLGGGGGSRIVGIGSAVCDLGVCIARAVALRGLQGSFCE